MQGGQAYPPSDRPYCQADPTSTAYAPPQRGENTYYRTWDAQQNALTPSVGAHGQTSTTPSGFLPPYQPSSMRDEETERYVEHIYESPKSLRREMGRDVLQYYELENGSEEHQNGQKAGSASERVG